MMVQRLNTFISGLATWKMRLRLRQPRRCRMVRMISFPRDLPTCPQGVNNVWPFEWLSERTGISGNWGKFSVPVLQWRLGDPGLDGSPALSLYSGRTHDQLQHRQTPTTTTVQDDTDDHRAGRCGRTINKASMRYGNTSGRQNVSGLLAQLGEVFNRRLTGQNSPQTAPALSSFTSRTDNQCHARHTHIHLIPPMTVHG